MACPCPTNGNFPDDNTGCSGCAGCSQKCHETVDTFAEVSAFRNAFITVREENAVYHVDDVGNAVPLSRSPIFAANTYTPAVGDYKQVVVYKFSASQFYVFDPTGNFKTGTIV